MEILITVVTRFQLPAGLTADQIRAAFDEAAPRFRDVPGLIRKQFLRSKDCRTAGGVYLLSKVWKCQQTMTTRTVDQTISSLRRKLGDDAESPRYFITVYGVGYTLGTFTSYAPESRKTARALR